MTPAQTIRPIFIEVFNDGEPGSSRIGIAFEAGLTRAQKDHLKARLMEEHKDEVVNPRWRTGRGKSKGHEILALIVKTGGQRRHGGTTGTVCEVKHDLEFNVQKIISTMT